MRLGAELEQGRNSAFTSLLRPYSYESRRDIFLRLFLLVGSASWMDEMNGVDGGVDDSMLVSLRTSVLPLSCDVDCEGRRSESWRILYIPELIYIIKNIGQEYAKQSHRHSTATSTTCVGEDELYYGKHGLRVSVRGVFVEVGTAGSALFCVGNKHILRSFIPQYILTIRRSWHVAWMMAAAPNQPSGLASSRAFLVWRGA